MARAMYEYSKTVLRKVSFNSDLFYKELEKALQRLLPHEINELRKKCNKLIIICFYLVIDNFETVQLL